MADIAHEETDKLLSEMEKKIAREYRQAVQEVEKKLNDYLMSFQKKDAMFRQQVKDGELSESDYKKWKTGQIMTGQRWEKLKETLAEDMLNADKIARSTINGYMSEAYALNMNYATYKIEHDAKVNTSFMLYNRHTVERIRRENPQLLPKPGQRVKADVAAGRYKAWEEGQIQSVTLQAVLQGESISEMAHRIANQLGARSYADAVRYARTSMTGAQNAGRQDAYRRGENMGIKMARTWVATLDDRTRHEHRQLDGQTVGVDEPFEIDGEKLMFPGDPNGAPYLIWNCRCSTIPTIKGFERDLSDLSKRNTAHLGDMTYEEWKEEKRK